MKKLFLLSFLFTTLLNAYSQSVGIIYDNEEIADTLVLQISDLENFNVTYLDLFNKSSRNEKVRIRKEEIFLLEDSYNSFCFGENCYEVAEPDEVIEIAAGDTFSFAGQGEQAFHISYFANGKMGKSVINYTFYNADMPEDAHTITVIFDSETSLSVSEGNAMAEIEVFPNPTSDRIRLKQSLAWETATLHTLEGGQVRSWQVGQVNSFDVSDLSNGVYLLTLKNGQGQKSVKIIKQ